MNRVVRARNFNLAQGLKDTRRAAVAIGILMGRLELTRAQSFDLLRMVSQCSNRLMPVLADDVIATGTIDFPRLTGW